MGETMGEIKGEKKGELVDKSKSVIGTPLQTKICLYTLINRVF